MLRPVKIVTEAGSFDLPQDVSEGITERVMAKTVSGPDLLVSA
jgi:hypothetical protein